MKRFIIFFIIALLLIPILNTRLVIADSKPSIYSKIEIEEIARKKLGIKEGIELKHSNLHTQDTRQKRVWNLDFADDRLNISVAINAQTGEVINYNKWERTGHDRPVNFLRTEARKNAVDFVKSLEAGRFMETEEVTAKAPSIVAYRLEEIDTDTSNYNFLFVRKIKNEYFPNNYFKLKVSGATGEILQYEMVWDKSSYEKKADLISSEKARKIFEAGDRLQLKYLALDVNNKEEGEIPYLTPVYYYVPEESDLINAVDGKLLKNDELFSQWPHYRFMGDYGAGMDNMALKEMAAIEEALLIPEQGVIAREKAQEQVLSRLARELDLVDLQVRSSDYFNYFNGIRGKYWGINWYNDETGTNLHTITDAEEGNILSINYNKSLENQASYKEKEEKPILDNEDKLLAIKEDSLEKIRTILPNIGKDEIKFEIQSEDIENKILRISSPRYIGGIPYEANRINISYNYEEEEITNLYYSWNEVRLQPAPQIMDKEKIQKQFYDYVGLEKFLIQLQDKEAAKKEKLDLPLKDLIAVYSLKDYQFAYIDGINGNFIMANGEEYTGDKITKEAFTDVLGHPYKREIFLMDKMGILGQEGDKFKPDNSLLRQDGLKWLIELGWKRNSYPIDGNYEYYKDKDGMPFKDISKENKYYPYILAAVDNGILDKEEEYFNPEDQVKKIEITRWLIRAMGQGDLAEYKQIFQVHYADTDQISNDDIGYIALAKYHNLYDDKFINKESFEADKVLARGDYIRILYNLLNSK